MSQSKTFDPSLEFFGVPTVDTTIPSNTTDDDDITEDELRFVLKDYENIDFVNMSKNIQTFQEDPVVKEALTTTVDLSNYYNTIQSQLGEVERECIDDYINNAEDLATIYSKLVTCSSILDNIDDTISTFHQDLTTVSERIRGLQKKSGVMSNELTNHNLVLDSLSKITSLYYLSPDLINLLSHGERIDGNFGAACHAFYRKILYFNAYIALLNRDANYTYVNLKSSFSAKSSVIPTAGVASSQRYDPKQLQEVRDLFFKKSVPICFLHDLLPIVRSLQFKAISKSMKGIFNFISSLEKPLTNIPFKQSLSLDLAPVYKFLLASSIHELMTRHENTNSSSALSAATNLLTAATFTNISQHFANGLNNFTGSNNSNDSNHSPLASPTQHIPYIRFQKKDYAKEIIKTYTHTVSQLYNSLFSQYLLNIFRTLEAGSVSSTDVLGLAPPLKKSGLKGFLSSTKHASDDTVRYNTFVLGPRESLVHQVDQTLVSHISVIRQNDIQFTGNSNSILLTNSTTGSTTRSNVHYSFDKLFSSALQVLTDTVIQESNFIQAFFGLSTTNNSIYDAINYTDVLSSLNQNSRISSIQEAYYLHKEHVLKSRTESPDSVSKYLEKVEVLGSLFVTNIYDYINVVFQKNGKDILANNNMINTSGSMHNTLSGSQNTLTSVLSGGSGSGSNSGSNTNSFHTMTSTTAGIPIEIQLLQLHPLTICTMVFQPIFRLFTDYLEDYCTTTHDTLSLLVLIRILEIHLSHAHTHNVRTMDVFVESCTSMLWNRFKYLFDLQLQSLQYYSTLPIQLLAPNQKVLYVTVRYAEYVTSLRRLNVYTNTSVLHLFLIRLLHEYRSLLDLYTDKMSDPLTRCEFIINQCDIIVKTCIVRGFYMHDDMPSSSGTNANTPVEQVASPKPMQDFSGVTQKTTVACSDNLYEYHQFLKIFNVNCTKYVDMYLDSILPDMVRFVNAAEPVLRDHKAQCQYGQTVQGVSFTEDHLQKIVSHFIANWRNLLTNIYKDHTSRFSTSTDYLRLSPSLFAVVAMSSPDGGSSNTPTSPRANNINTNTSNLNTVQFQHLHQPPTCLADLPSSLQHCLYPVNQDLAKRTGLQLALYYKRFIDIITTVCGRRQPVFMRELLPVATIMSEFKKISQK